MKEVTRIQEQFCSAFDRRRLCSYDLEFIDHPTKALIHQASRFLYFLNGNGIIIVDNVEFEIKPHTMVAILPWEITVIKEVSKPLEFIKVIYNSDFVNNYMRNNYNPNNVLLNIIKMVEECPVAYFDEKQAAEILYVFDVIKKEIGEEYLLDHKEDNDVTNVLVVSKLVEILILYYRALTTNIENSYPKPVEKEHITKIFKYIYSHLQEKITLEKLSKIFYMSDSAISKYIQDSVGLSYSELVNEMRIAKVLDLLMYSDFTLSDIADTVGYSDASHVLKVFTQRMGTTPNEFRKIYHNSHEVLKKKERDVTYDVLNYIYNNYTEEITAQSVAERFHINLVELNRILMFQLERNFSDYLDYLRINKACELLITTPDAICDIAIACGYNTTKTFNRIFVNHKGMTPGVFRKTIDLQLADGSIANVGKV